MTDLSHQQHLSPRLARIMAVDDNVESLGFLERLLVNTYASVALFTNSAQALKAIPTFRPDVILLDVRMPDIDGYETCQQLKRNPQTKEIPVIFLSGLTSGDEIAAGFEAGGVDYVAKPINKAELLARLDTQILLHQAYACLKAQNQQLHELERYRDTLVHMMVHDMRSPLQAILGHLQILEEESKAQLSPREKNSLGQAIRATRLLSRMTRELIDISRLENQNMPLIPERIDVSARLKSLIASELDIQSCNQTIVIKVPKEASIVEADPLLFERILLNLIGNALKYSPQGSTITIRSALQSEGVLIAVEDQGPGIAVENMDMVFHKFATFQTDTEYRKHSSGLGLTFCKLAVEAHGGTIGFENIAPCGCRFWFVLPKRNLSSDNQA